MLDNGGEIVDQNKILNSSQMMFNVAKDLEKFDKSLSDICLFVADKLLRIVECCQQQKPSSLAKEKVVDSVNVVAFTDTNEASQSGLGKDQVCVGHGTFADSSCGGHQDAPPTMCIDHAGVDENCPIHGKDATGQSVDCDCPIHGKDATGQAIGKASDEIEKDVQDLVSKIRSKMGKQ